MSDVRKLLRRLADSLANGVMRIDCCLCVDRLVLRLDVMPSSVEEDELSTGGIGVGIILQVELFFRCVSSLMNFFLHWELVFLPALFLLARVFCDR